MKSRLFLYSFLLGVFAIFSYSLTAPNLVLTSWQHFWQFQEWMWNTFFNDRFLLSLSFIGLSLLIWLAYYLIIAKAKSGEKTETRKRSVSWLSIALVVSPLLLANNALSHDVFNYIFNARMVIHYQANPHQQVALDFAQDPWTRFMHNTHTPAPYSYGWTALSLIPYFIGAVLTGSKFLPTWLSFRFFSYLSWLGLVWLGWRQQKKTPKKHRWWYYALWLNPLLIIEVVANVHNDLWMMVPAVASLLLLIKRSTTQSWPKKLLSLVLLIISISTKQATLALVPLWFILACQWHWLRKISPFLDKSVAWLKDNWAFVASFLMFLPLLTARSKHFLPWYLSWSLVWLPFINKRWSPWKWSLLVLSLSSWLRYIPYLWTGNFEGAVIPQQKLITWLPFGLFWLIILIKNIFKAKVENV